MSLWRYYDKHPEEFWKDFGGNVSRKEKLVDKIECLLKEWDDAVDCSTNQSLAFLENSMNLLGETLAYLRR